jgi:cytochrome P450
MCIGAGFALQEATLVLATIMGDFNIALAPGQTVWPQQRLTLRPRDPLLLRVELRKGGQRRAPPLAVGTRRPPSRPSC